MQYIIIYCYLVIFGGWILNILPIPSSLGFFVINLLDILPLLFFCWNFKLTKSSKIVPNSTTFWLLIITFLFISLASTIYHSGRISAPLIHFGAMFRYVPLATFICQWRNALNVSMFIRHFTIITVIILLISYIEIIGGSRTYNFFLPLTKEESSANLALLKDDSNSICGIFPNSVDLSYLLLLSYIIFSNINIRINKFVLFIIFLIPVYFTGSKATLILFIFAVNYNIAGYRLIKALFIGTIILVVGVLLYEFWELFYWTVFIDSQASRLGLIIFTLPSFLSEISFDTFFGMGPDKNLVFNKINSYANAPSMTRDIDAMSAFEDEFYVAIIVYYGIIGFMLLCTLFGGLYRNLISVKWNNGIFKHKTIVKSLFTILIIAPLFNQIIIIKPFSLFFWIFIGLLFNVSSKRKISLPTK